MKKLVLSLAVVAMVAMVSCGGGEAARKQFVKDSLAKDSVMKDSIVKVEAAAAAAQKVKADSIAKADSTAKAEEAAKKGGKKAKK